MSSRICLLLVFVLAAIFDVTYCAVISCPAADDISHCVCSHDQGLIDIECNGLTQDDYQRLTVKFPQVVNINKLTIKTQENINITQGIANFRINELILDGPVDGDLSTVLRTSAFDLRKITIKSSELTSFPFSLLPEMTMLERLVLDNCPNMTYLEKLVSCSLKYFSAMNGGLTSLPTGVIDGTPSLVEFIVTGNKIREIESNTFGLNCVLADISVANNYVNYVQTDAFYDASSEDCEPSLISLHLQHNYRPHLAARSIPITKSSMTFNFAHSVKFVPLEAPFFFMGTPAENSLSFGLQYCGIRDLYEDFYSSIIPYVRDGGLGLENNPIDCRCVINWMVTDPAISSKVAAGTECMQDVNFHHVDLDKFEANCS